MIDYFWLATGFGATCAWFALRMGALGPCKCEIRESNGWRIKQALLFNFGLFELLYCRSQRQIGPNSVDCFSTLLALRPISVRYFMVGSTHELDGVTMHSDPWPLNWQ